MNRRNDKDIAAELFEHDRGLVVPLGAGGPVELIGRGAARVAKDVVVKNRFLHRERGGVAAVNNRID